MVKNILATFRDGVDKLEWMTPETKKTAKARDHADRRRLSRIRGAIIPRSR